MGSGNCCRRRSVFVGAPVTPPGLVRPQIGISIYGLNHIGIPGYLPFEPTIQVDATLQQLKRLIKPDPEHIDLFFEHVQLDDSRSLHSYNLLHGIVLGYCDRRDTPGLDSNLISRVLGL